MIVQRYVSGLHVGEELRYEVWRKDACELESLHLRQSPIDRACGLHCVLMAAMLGFGISRATALSVATSRRPILSELWRVARDDYFAGVTAGTIKNYLRLIQPDVKLRQLGERHSDLFESVASEIEKDNIALMLVGSGHRSNLHWVLVIGAERPYELDTVEQLKKPSKRPPPIALLGLDPSSPAPALSAFNWRMCNFQNYGKRGMKCVSTAGGGQHRKLVRAVIIGRNSERSKRVKSERNLEGR